MEIQIDYAADDSCQIRLWARGTHDPVAFRQACEARLRAWDRRETSLSGAPVLHGHFRSVAADARTRACGVCERVRVPSQPGRGAFAATELDVWLPLHAEPEMAGA